MELAISHHQAGRLDEAQVLYRQILTQYHRDANVPHLLGLLASQAGRFDEGAELIKRASPRCLARRNLIRDRPMRIGVLVP